MRTSGSSYVEQAPLVFRDTEHTARHELPAVLRLIDAGKVAVSAKTLRPSAAAVRRIGAVLSGGDFFPAAGRERFPVAHGRPDPGTRVAVADAGRQARRAAEL